MSRHPDNAFFLSTLSSPVMPAGRFGGIVRNSGLSGIEIDLHDSGRYRLQGWSRATETDLRSVKAIWFAPQEDLRLPARVTSLIEGAGSQSGSLTLVVDQPNRPTREALASQTSTAIKLRTLAGAGTRIAIAVRPHPIENTRAHLANLSAMRLQASEWDLEIALDLGRELDWLWEAEAAMYRVIGSLGLIRLSYPTSTFDGRFRASLTQRTILSCSELGYRGDFSLMVPLPWWHWRNPKSLQAACSDAATRIGRHLRDGAPAFESGAKIDSIIDRNA